ncbi:MAG: AbrB/MazE/SpoVT family DNA-binding domain-containing protein [Aestuariibacter sp.]|nr:AbrB/MazE/SpoVT family DNA-binding domain-containing protein [Aestuariibacter sp.]
MSKVTKKLQVSLPKALADEYDIRPGDDLEWQAAGDVLRVVPPDKRSQRHSIGEQLQLFDQATQRQHERNWKRQLTVASERGWTRDELYERGNGTD